MQMKRGCDCVIQNNFKQIWNVELELLLYKRVVNLIINRTYKIY